MLKFKGSRHLRQRLVLSTLTGRPLRITEIRARDQNPGLRDFEASLLRLLEKLSNGCVVEINETGTTLRFKPGFVIGGDIVHDCGKSRAIGYYLEPLLLISLFGRKPLRCTLRGITNDSVDPGVDVWRTVTLPLLRSFLNTEVADELQLKVLKRGCAPQIVVVLKLRQVKPFTAISSEDNYFVSPFGGGEVWLNVPVIKSLNSISKTEEGMVKRIRGIAFSTKVSPQSSNRLVDGARGVLNSLLSDVYIFTDHMSGAPSGHSPGYGLTLVAETTKKGLISSEAIADLTDKSQEKEMTPEEVGKRCAYALLNQIHAGGVVDSLHQGMAIMLCALGPEEINEIRVGPLSPYAVWTLRHIKEALGVTFSIKPEADSETIFLSCVGAGIQNAAKRSS